MPGTRRSGSGNATKVTGEKAASAAARILGSAKSTKAQKQVAGSDLSQKPPKRQSARKR
jgi:hypothetical protein